MTYLLPKLMCRKYLYAILMIRASGLMILFFICRSLFCFLKFFYLHKVWVFILTKHVWTCIIPMRVVVDNRQCNLYHCMCTFSLLTVVHVVFTKGETNTSRVSYRILSWRGGKQNGSRMIVAHKSMLTCTRISACVCLLGGGLGLGICPPPCMKPWICMLKSSLKISVTYPTLPTMQTTYVQYVSFIPEWRL